MTTPPSAPLLIPYSPVGTPVITAVSGLTPAQVGKLTAPFKVGERVKGVATLQTFTVAVNLDDLVLESPHRLTVWLWVLGNAAKYAALGYNPVPGKPVKSGLWRLGPSYHGGEAEDADIVAVALPAPAKVARLRVVVQGLYRSPGP